MDTVTSSILVGNLHCPSCVTTIREVLQAACQDHIRWVSPNIVTSVVTVEHNHKAPLAVMVAALEDAGFEICGVEEDPTDADFSAPAAVCIASSSTTPPPPPPTTTTWGLSRWMAPRQDPAAAQADQLRQAHLANCAQCRLQQKLGTTSEEEKAAVKTAEVEAETETPESTPEVTPATSPSATATPPSPTVPSSTPPFVAIEDGSRPRWRVSLAVGGMTCAVCVNTITDALRQRDGILDVTVNLIANSATVVVDDKQRIAQVLETLDDLGYDATLDTVTAVEEKPSGDGHDYIDAAATPRTVDIAISGLYCEHCPARIARSLAGFRRASLQIETRPTPQRPILRLSYVPDAPRFTIRHILAAIAAADGALTATLHHPPSLAQRSRRIRARHQRQLLARVVGTGLAAVPTLLLGVVYMSLVPATNATRVFLTAPWVSGISRAQIGLFVCATPVYFFAASLFHTRALAELRALWRRGSRTPVLQRFYRFGSMNTLISLGTTIAYVSSVAQMLASAAAHATATADDTFYFDSVVFLTFFLLLGRLLEAYSKARTGDAVDLLGRLRPTTALLVDDDDKDEEIAADLLERGDVVRVPHGASPPADGVVVRGATRFDESSLTGEARLVPKTANDPVYAGTVNQGEAAVCVRVTAAGGAAGGASLLDQIVAAVREGQTRRAPMEQIADLLTTYFVPAVTLVAVGTWLVWMGLGLGGRLPLDYLGDHGAGRNTASRWITFALQFAIAVFVVACPCGLGLAAPTAIFVGSGLAARWGILAKGGGEAFEKASRIDCVVFDKTGTLTVGGAPAVTDSLLVGDTWDHAPLLAALRAVEANSSHPVAKAIVAHCGDVAAGTVDGLQEIAGRGMRATFRGAGAALEVLVGNEALMQAHDVAVSDDVADRLREWQADAQSVALLAVRPADSDSESDASFSLALALAVADPERPEAAPVIAALHARGLLVYMLSGDHPVTAAAVARRLGIPSDHVIAGVLPTDKAARIQALQASLPARHGRRATVAMVGDGINDAPALTQADVAIAVGSGADVAIASADFVLVQSTLGTVLLLLDLSRAVFRRITLNFAWALVYNVLAVPVAAGALYPVHTRSVDHVRLDPVWASLAMALSSVSVVLSSLALRSPIPGVGFRPTKIAAP